MMTLLHVLHQVGIDCKGAKGLYLSDLRPSGLSKLLSDKSIPEAARLSPLVRAPRDCNRLATAAAKRFSPPRLVATSLYIGPVTCEPHEILSYTVLLTEDECKVAATSSNTGSVTCQPKKKLSQTACAHILLNQQQTPTEHSYSQALHRMLHITASVIELSGTGSCKLSKAFLFLYP